MKLSKIANKIAKSIFTFDCFFLSLACLGIASAILLGVLYFVYGATANYLFRGLLHFTFSFLLLPEFKWPKSLKFGFTFILVYLLFSPL